MSVVNLILNNNKNRQQIVEENYHRHRSVYLEKICHNKLALKTAIL